MRTIIHIGVPKSGTSSLKKAAYDDDRLAFIGRREWEGMARLHRLDEYDAPMDGLLEAVDALGRDGSGRPILISHEALSAIVQPSYIASRLASALPQAEILITIRSQYTAIPSYYGNHAYALKGVPGKYNGRRVSWRDWFEFAIRRDGYTYLDTLRYARLTEIYRSRFSKIHVVPIENHGNFQSVFGFALSIGHENTHNRKRTRRPVVLSEPERVIVREKFAKENAAIAERFGLSLQGFDYPFPASSRRSDERIGVDDVAQRVSAI